MPNCSIMRADCTGVGAIRECITPLLLLIVLLLLVLLVVLFWLCPLLSTLCEFLLVKLFELLVGALPNSTMSSTSRASRVRLACSMCMHTIRVYTYMYICLAHKSSFCYTSATYSYSYHWQIRIKYVVQSLHYTTACNTYIHSTAHTNTEICLLACSSD
jgi:hypothetical protein